MGPAAVQVPRLETASGRRRPRLYLAWAELLRWGPTTYLLSRPAIDGVQFGQAWPGAIVMIGEHRATDARNIQECQLALEKAAHGFFVGGVEHGAAGPAAARDFIP